jgi:hypothetical protein
MFGKWATRIVVGAATATDIVAHDHHNANATPRMD